ncbi:MAG: bifunctional pyr operon transcriptional regulator/uracil phosphoribosyltransferase PyrR [Opitutaceae bacterium]|nr:bifunctional pyr operon transcriptional regulator/uracil phosphoribosyltransferase PyrR [Opitutaceae bacterium]
MPASKPSNPARPVNDNDNDKDNDSKTLSADDIHQAIERLAAAIRSRQRSGKRKLVLLGIANGGIELARRLGSRIRSAKVGTIDISFHRDDIGRHPIPKEYTPTLIPIDIDDANVVLVDDVLFSGRTINAALNELFDHGRPACVELAILVDRGGRRLPIAADFTGITLDVEDSDKVVVKLGADNAAATDSIVVKAEGLKT